MLRSHAHLTLRSCLLFLAITTLAVASPGLSAGQQQTQSLSAAAPIPISDPVAAERYFHDQRAAPSRTIPPGALLHAQQDLQARVRSGAMPVFGVGQRGKSTSLSPIGQPTLSTSSWAAIGPDPISTGLSGQNEGPLPSSGRVTAIAVKDASNVYVGESAAGVWKTTDGGTTWSALTDNLLTSFLTVGALAIDPTSSSILYAGLGEQNYGDDSYGGNGVLKSTDGGTTWSLSSPSIFLNQGIARVAVDANNHLNVYAAAAINTRDFSPPNQVPASAGLVSSSDGGSTWSAPSNYTGFPVTDVALDTTSSPGNTTIYFARGATGGDANNGVWMTSASNVSGNVAPTKLVGTGSNLFPTTNVGRIRLAITRTNPARLYAIVANSSNSDLLGIWTTSDGGANWTILPNPETTTSSPPCMFCYYALDVEVSPTPGPNGDVIAALTTQLFMSTNAGNNWTNVSNPAIDWNIHTDQHALGFVPGDNSTFYVGNDGGIYKGTSYGASFSDLNGALPTVTFWRGAVPPSGKTTAIGGSQDNGAVSYTGSLGWKRVIGGDGGYAAIDYTDGNNNVYATYQNMNLWVSTTGVGGSFNSRSTTQAIQAEAHQYITPLVMDPSNPSVLYTGGVHLYKSPDGGNTWATVPSLSPQDLSGADTPLSSISAIAVAPSATSTIYVGTGADNTGTSKLWVTTDGTTWNDRTAGLPDRFITSIAVSPTESSVAYVTLSGFGTGHVWKTVDAGLHWSDVSGTGPTGVPDAPVNAIQINPTQQQITYIGTDVGVFVSTTGGGSWGAISPGTNGMPAATIIGDLVLNRSGTELFAFTHGRSAYVADVTALSGTPYAWGADGDGQIGNNTTSSSPVLTPVAVQVSGGASLTGVTAVAAAGAFSLGLGSDGSVWSWGNNHSGQLGSGNTTSRSYAARVVGQGGSGTLGGIAGVAAGNSHTVAVASDGTVWTWGDNTFGQLGTNSTAANATTPQHLSALSGISAVAAGHDFDLALRNDGTVWAWGANDKGQLGATSSSTCGTTPCSLVPLQVVGSCTGNVLCGVSAIAAGQRFSMALKPDGTVWTWGTNFSGELGTGSTQGSSASPVQVAGSCSGSVLCGIGAIAAGSHHALAMTSDGATVWAWGDNTYGQLGATTTGTCGTSPCSRTPLAVSGLGATAIAVAAGNNHSLAIVSNNTVDAWGSNSNGQLGNTSVAVGANSQTPVQVSGLTGATGAAGGAGHSLALKTQ